MKAHRRKGIPTLMLQQGGAPFLSRSDSPTELGRVTDSIYQLTVKPIADRERRLRASFEQQEMNRRANALRGIRRGIPGLLTASDPDQLKTARGIAKKVAPIPSMQDYRNAARSPSYGESITDALNSASRAEANSQLPPNFLEPIKQEAARLEALRSPFSKQAMSVQDELMKSALESSQAKKSNLAKAQAQAKTQTQRAADALSGGVLRPPTTPVEKAKAAQAEQAAETAKASQAAASVSSPEEEALRQATGAPSSAEEAAAATKSGDLSQEASLVKGKDGTTIAGIMGSADAQFNETERLNELKTTFGLNLSDMEKAAPGIAFSLSLMGAQRAPGESVFNALARSAGSAGEGALKAKLALDAKERAIDSSLVSTVLGEKKIADAYAKNKTWAGVWDGSFDKNGSPGASFYRMNARQLDEATEAGLPIVPMDFLKSSMTTEGAKAAYRSKAGIDSRKNLMDQLMERAKPVSTEIEVGGDKYKAQVWTDRSGVRHVLPIDIAGVANGLNAQLADTSKFLRSTAEMRTYVPQISGGPNVVAAFGGRLRAIAGVSQDEIDRTPEQLAGAIFAKARKEFDTVKLGGLLSGKNAAANISSEMSSDEIGKYFGKEAQDLAESGDAEALQKLIQGRLPQITNLTMPERPGEGAKPEELTSYQARVKYKTIQNALAAQLAPILLGESGRTISDADRVRVIALLGGFADYSKAGVVTTEFEMNASIDELESILRKYQKTSKDASETFLDNVGEASQSDSWDPVQGKIYNPTISQNKALGRLGENFLKIFGSPDGSSNPDQPDSTPTRKLSELVE